jgi:peptide/nickel transport system permease protein
VTAYAIRRTLIAIPTLFATSVLIFLMVRLMPGDVVDYITQGEGSVDPEQRRQIEHQLGLDQSYFQQYIHWIKGLVTGDMGNSLASTIPVAHTLRTAIPITAEIVFLGLLFAVVVAVPLGILSAVRPNSYADFGSRIGALIGISVPNFWLATLFLIFTSRVLHWVPPVSYIPPSENLGQNLLQFLLPALSISVFTLALLTRMIRATMLEVLGLDYVRTAKAKGLTPRRVVYRHAFRNSLIPVVTIVGFQIGALIAGSAIVETIYGLPGVGYILLQALRARDYTVIQDATLLIAVIVITMNLLVDLLYGFIDPRISLS